MEQQNYNNRRREYNNPRSSHGTSNPDWDQTQRSQEDWSSRGRNQNYNRADRRSDRDENDYGDSSYYRHSYNESRDSHGKSNPDWDEAVRSREDRSSRGPNQNYGRSEKNSDYQNVYRTPGSHGNYHPFDDGNYGEYGRSDASDEGNYGGSGSYGNRNDRNDDYNRSSSRSMNQGRNSDRNYIRSGYTNSGNRKDIDDRNYFDRSGNKFKETRNDITDRNEERGYRGKLGFENHNYDQDYYERLNRSRNDNDINEERGYRGKLGFENHNYDQDYYERLNRSRNGNYINEGRGYRGKLGFENHNYDQDYYRNLIRESRDRDENSNYYSGTYDSYDQNNRSYFNPEGSHRDEPVDWNIGNYGDRAYENHEKERYERNRKRNLHEDYNW